MRQYAKTKLTLGEDTLKAIESYNWPGNIRELRNFCERMLILLSGQIIRPENLPQEIKLHTKGRPGASGFALPEGGIVLENLEMELIQQALDQSRGNQSKAARLLGLTRSALLYRMKKYAIA